MKFLLFLLFASFFLSFSLLLGYRLKHSKEGGHSYSSQRTKINNNNIERVENEIITIKIKKIKALHRILHNLMKLCEPKDKKCELEIRAKRSSKPNRQKEINQQIKFANPKNRVERSISEEPKLKQREIYSNDELEKSYDVSDDLRQQIMEAENIK